MASQIVTDAEFSQGLNNGTLVPSNFKYKFLVEGDSWMDRSAALAPSLLQKLAPEMDIGHEDTLFINLSMFGDTMRRINECLSPLFIQWVNHTFNWKFDAILLSAGGNDFIDAARDPGPGQGILRDMQGLPLPANGSECLNPDAVAALVDEWLDPSFSNFYNVIQASKHADVPIFLNSYDTPTARKAPASAGGRTWLRESYIKNGIDPTLWPELTGRIFLDIKSTMTGWAKGRTNVFAVPSEGTLTPAAENSVGSDQDWLNEIHPNARGWGKLATVWRASIKAVI